jgi:uncharacterized membrane protein
MSQKKVEKYKEYKRNKEQILKREKRIRAVEFGVIIVICCVFVGWFGYSIYDSAVQAKKNSAVPAEIVEIDMNAYRDYVDGLSSTFSEN